MKSWLLVFILAGIAYAGTTIRDQSVPETWAIAKEATTASLKAETPAKIGELRINTDNFDLYTATGTGAGDWRNVRLGIGP